MIYSQVKQALKVIKNKEILVMMITFRGED
jgi:hypothetical protein